MGVAGATVTVGSKLHLPVTLWLMNNSGKKEEHTIRGVALRPGQSKPFIVGGQERVTKAAGEEQMFLEGAAALTPGIPAEFWDRWKLAYKEWPPYARGHIFAHEKTEGAAAIAQERRAERTGLEPIDPANPSPQVKPYSADD